MNSKLTREQLHERARENVKALKMASRQTAFESAREEILADLQLAEMALAAMESEPVESGEYGDAYQGAREDLAIWKRRALEAEESVRRLEQINDHLVKEAQGESRMGEPVIAQPAPVVPENCVTVEHRRVIEMLLNVCGAAFELADDSCQQDVDGEDCHVVPDDAFQKLSDALDEIENTLPTEDIDRPDVFLAWSAMPRAALKSILQPGNSPAIPDGWTCNDKANAALMMLDRIETADPVDDDRIDGIKLIVSELVAATQPQNAPQNIPEIISGWIPVSERMPEDRTQVILWDAEIGEVTSGHYSHKTHTFYHCGDAIENEITHWMAPPAAPQEVSDA